MELIFILLQALLILTIFSIVYPVLSNYKNNVNSTNFINQLIFNSVLHLNFILFLTFLNITLDFITLIYFLSLLTIFIFAFFKNIRWFYSNRYYYFWIFIILFILSTDIAYSLALDWDSQIVWLFKTLNFYNEGTIKDLSNLPRGDGYSYPYLGSLTWAFFWNISFINEEYSGRIIYIFLYIVSLFALCEKLKANLISKLIFLLFLILLSYNYIFFGGSQDILIFCFISFAAFYLHDIFIKKIKKLEKSNLIILPLIFNCLIWTKNEGVIYSFIILFLISFFSQIKLSQKIFLIFSTIFLLILKIFIYKYFNLDLSINSLLYENISVLSIISGIFSIKTIIFLKNLFLFGFLKNYFFIIGVVFGVIYLYLKGIDKKIAYICIFYILSLGFLLVAHTSINESLDLAYMLKVNMHRLVFAISPFFILIVVENLNNLKNKI